jgi:hypothetical protein
MKKFITIIIALLYTAITSGFTVHAHYCMGKLAEINFKVSTDLCGKCGKSGKCCHDEVKFCKVNVQHETVKVQQTVVPASKDLSLPVIIVPVPPVSISSFILYQGHAPPEEGNNPLYIQYCTYLI